MKTLNTNLELIVGSLLMKNPIKQTATKAPKVNTLATAERINKVLECWNELGQKIFDFFKGEKGSANMVDLKEKFKKELDFINENIRFEDISYEVSGKYIKAFIGQKRIAQFSTENKKLLPNKFGQGFLIWSILGHITCNGKTPLCASYCYNNSKSFAGHIVFKTDCLITSQLGIFEKIIEKMLTLSPHKETFVRIHEDGDFYDMEYFNKWMNVAKNNKNMTFEAYTKEPELLEKVEKINAENENVVLRFSLMEDSATETIQFVRENSLPNYTCLGTKKKDAEANKVFEYIAPKNRCVDSCEYCKKCYRKNNITLVTKIH